MIRWFITTFIAVAILSACWPWMRKLGIGRMPGDFTLRIGGGGDLFSFMSTGGVFLVVFFVFAGAVVFCRGPPLTDPPADDPRNGLDPRPMHRLLDLRRLVG